MVRSAAFLLVLLLTGSAHVQTEEQVSARLTPTVHACEESPENSGTLSQAPCYKDEAVRQDQDLNRTWINLIRRVSSTRRAFLRRDERQWIKDRDEDCHGEASAYINSTASYVFNVCMVKETIRRTIWLEHVQ
jgi:uncharacterized protein YecT (DUF1311 family)